jgi:competence protein ComGC
MRELFGFLKQEKKFWLLPLCIVLVLITTLLVVVESSAIAPFVYGLF